MPVPTDIDLSKVVTREHTGATLARAYGITGDDRDYVDVVVVLRTKDGRVDLVLTKELTLRDARGLLADAASAL